MSVRTDGWMDDWMHGWASVCCLFVSSRPAGPLAWRKTP